MIAHNNIMLPGLQLSSDGGGLQVPLAWHVLCGQGLGPIITLESDSCTF